MAAAPRPGLLGIMAKVAYGSTEDTNTWLKEKELLASMRNCTACGTSMHWQKRSNLSDGYQWRCPRSGCQKKLSIRDKSFFQRSRLRLQTWVKLMYLWATDTPVTKLQEQLDEGECSTKTAIDIFNFLREVCTNKLIAIPPIKLGGPNTIIYLYACPIGAGIRTKRCGCSA